METAPCWTIGGIIDRKMRTRELDEGPRQPASHEQFFVTTSRLAAMKHKPLDTQLGDDPARVLGDGRRFRPASE